jgi:hypothetical protein
MLVLTGIINTGRREFGRKSEICVKVSVPFILSVLTTEVGMEYRSKGMKQAASFFLTLLCLPPYTCKYIFCYSAFSHSHFHDS